MQTQLDYPAPHHQLLSPALVRLIRFNQSFLYWIINAIMLLLPHRARVLVSMDELSLDYRYVITANHQSMADPFIICCSLPRELYMRLVPFRYFAHNGLFDRILQPILFSLGAFPAGRNKQYAYGLTAAQLFMKHGQTVVIFPEGRRVVKPVRPRSGIEVMARQPDVRVIPARIQWHKNRWGWRSYQVTFGQPLKERDLSAQQILNRIYKLPLE